jgi:transcriptional regulator of acetoin/glycerol metabolism
MEKRHILRVLRACGGRHGESAKTLGIGRTTLWRKMQDHGIDLTD